MTSAASPPVGRVRTLVALTKPRIVELLLATALPTCFLAAHGLPPLWPTVAVLVGGSLAAGSANTFNSVYDRDIDAVMPRTHNRPAARGQVSAATAVVQGFVLGLGSVVVLVFMANLMSALLAIAAIAFYAVGYTMLLKRRTPQNIVWGGAAGCMPVLIAWAAITGSLSWTPLLLFTGVNNKACSSSWNRAGSTSRNRTSKAICESLGFPLASTFTGVGMAPDATFN